MIASIITGTTLLTVAAFSAALLSSSKESKYLYINARINARLPYVIDKKRAAKLAESGSLPDFINKLRDTEHYTFLESIDKNSIFELNMALEESLISSLKNIEKISPKRFKEVFNIYTAIYEAKIIKTFFRSRFSKIDISKHILEPIGNINPSLLKHLHDTKTIADMKTVLRDTKYRELLKKEYTAIEEFDSEIEKQIIEEISSIMSGLKRYEKKQILPVFHKREEIRNILMLIKLRIRKIDKEKQKELIRLERFDVARLIDSDDLKTFVDHFKNTEYEDSMTASLQEFEKKDNYYAFEKNLTRHYLDFVKENDIRYNIGPYQIISYIAKKEIEEKNLLIAAKGIISGKDKQSIKEMLL